MRKFLFFILFTVNLYADWTLPATTLDPTGRNGRIAFDGAGNAIAIWQTATADIVASRYDVKTDTFGPTTTLSSASSTLPDIAMNSAGDALAVWSEQDSPFQVRAARFNGETLQWENIGADATLLAELGMNANPQTFPRVATDPSGNGLAIWIKFDMGTFLVQSARFNATTGLWENTLGNAINLSEIIFSADSPNVVMDGNGNGLAIWVDDSNLIRSSRFNGTTSTWERTEANAFILSLSSSSFPQISINSEGTAFAVWHVGGGDSRIEAARFDPLEGSWGDTEENAVLLGNSTFGEANPQIAVGQSGNALATWTELASALTAKIHAARFNQAEGIWQQTETNSVQLSLVEESSINSRVAIDAQGNGLSIFSTLNIIGPLSAARYNADSNLWVDTQSNAIVLQESMASPVQNAQVLFDPQGNAFAIWSLSPGVFIARFEPTFPINVSSFRGQVINNRFAVQTDRVHKLTWSPVFINNVVAYRIKADGVLIGEVSQEGPYEFFNHNRAKDVPVLYSITTVNSDGAESVIPLFVTLN